MMMKGGGGKPTIITQTGLQGKQEVERAMSGLIPLRLSVFV